MEIPDQHTRFVGNKADDNIALFMSPGNRDRIQRLIIKQVYQDTQNQVAIGKQSDQELQVVMIGTLQQHYNLHLPLQELNRMVVQHCTKNIMTNIGYYLNYVKDRNQAGAGSLDTPLDLLLPANTRSTKQFKQNIF